MSGQQGSMPPPPPGPPYAPQVAMLGGTPTVGVDIPICAVLLALFILSATGHMTIFQLNRKKGHRFLMSAAMFGLSMSRVATMVVRIAWSTRPNNVRLAMAAQILTSAGVVILYIVNLLFAQRIIRATHPNLGWHKAFSRSLIVLYALIVVTLVMIITVSIQSYYTLDRNIRLIDRDFQLTVQSCFTFATLLPIPVVILGLKIPYKSRVEKFGTGRWRSKIAILLTASALLCLGSGFKCGTAFEAARPISNPAWYHAKWCYYVFNFAIELTVLYLYLAVRVDRRFHVPNGSKQVGDYCGCNAEVGKEKMLDHEGLGGLRIVSEEELFDDAEYCNCSRSGSTKSGARPDDPEAAPEKAGHESKH